MGKPTHIGFIMDGNRRWAKARGLPSFEGHRRGYLKVLDVVEWGIENHIPVLSFFAFSTENWKRSKKEVAYLMDLVRLVFTKHLDEFDRKGVRIVVSGGKTELERDILDSIETAERRTRGNTVITAHICFNYGGRGEIVEAVRSIIRDGLEPSRVNESAISKRLFHDLPDPDMIVRTSGEQRLSNFLTWQSVYSELLFIKKHWPSFSKKDFDHVIEEFAERHRRYGK